MTGPTLDIVGAGPSGLSAAIAVRDVGARFRGDFQGLENRTSKTDVLAELEGMDIQAQFDHSPNYEIVCLSADGASDTVRATGPIFYLLRRGPQPATLDQVLKAQALAAGVAIHFDERRRQISGGNIVAEGPHRADVFATGYIFATDMANGCYATVSDRFAPAGYSYLFIEQGRGTVTNCMFRDFHNERRRLEATVDFYQRAVGLRRQSARRFGGSGDYQYVNTIRMGNHRHIGDSAGFQDALFGFGLRYALMSGHLAGRRVAQGGAYDHAWRLRLAGLNGASLCNRWLFERMGDRGRRWVLKRGVADRDPRRILSRLYAPAPWKTAIAGRLPITPLHRERRQVDCGCTWCRCQVTAVGAEEA